MHPHKLPAELAELIKSGCWPSVEPNRQDLEPLLGETAARKLSPDDDRIVLMVPPFHTIADEVRGENDFWTQDLTNIGEIDYENALIFADFGMGSDSPIILYYGASTEPSVMFLRWSGNGKDIRHDWVTTHRSFAEFAAAVGLAESLQ